MAVVGDHGEELGEHGELTHGLLVYEPSLRVPLVLRAPGALPSGWVDVVEVNDEALVNLADLEALAAAENKHVMLVEIHTLGDWMIRLKLETIIPETVQEKRHLWNHLLDLPAIPFRLKAGGIGAITPANIVRATVCPPFDGVAETALSADLMQSIRS